ncbi:MAG: DNA-3-methyladenine glycosylase [Candidatus Babeliales bacterium]|nr:DNA-3-methyladenine glycosylase [Candidatus Babeliales bacterium]
MNYLKKSFYEQDTVIVAKSLLGALIVHEIDGKFISGYIVETEAYRVDDAACHAYEGKRTNRNAALFGPVAHAYVYISYGIHFCINIVSHSTDTCAGGVLIRALQPVDGIEYMQEHRNKTVLKDLTNGPGKLTQAMGITMHDNGADILHGTDLYIAQGMQVPDGSIVAVPRIGISQAKNHLWRFYIKGNPFVSRN